MTTSQNAWRRRLGARGALVVCGLSGLLAAPPVLADELSAFASRLASLRGEVESLSAELSDKTQAMQDQLRSQARQKAELELELSREKARLQKLRLSVAEKQKEIAADKTAGQALQPLFERNLAAVRDYVKQSLPFRTQERLAELDKLDAQLKAGLLTPQRALMRLWTFVEDEFRMTRENGLFRQTIELDGQEQLADVIRVGNVALYFRTSDGRMGFVIKEGSAWTFREVTDKEGRRQIADLFDSFKKQIRVGFFALPNALPVGQ